MRSSRLDATPLLGNLIWKKMFHILNLNLALNLVFFK
jgi:hypothetical protein